MIVVPSGQPGLARVGEEVQAWRDCIAVRDGSFGGIVVVGGIVGVEGEAVKRRHALESFE